MLLWRGPKCGCVRARRGRVRIARMVASCLGITACLHSAAGAGDEIVEVVDDAPQYGWREMWGGADATKDVWLLYTGVTLAPLSRDIYTNGLRLKMTSGYGQYLLHSGKKNCVEKAGETCRSTSDVAFTYTDVLVGYHMQMGPLTAKAFAGGSMNSHDSVSSDLHKELSGRAFGATLALEFWLNVGDDAWSSLDLSYTMAHDTGSLRARTGWRVLPTLSIGPELRFDTNAQASSGRAGLFARYEWFGGEISTAAGFAQSICYPRDSALCADDDGQQFEPYATINVLTQF